MPIIQLKEDTVSALPIPASRDIYYWDSDTTGFGVRVYYNGNRVYVVRYKNNQGTQSLKTLGTVEEISLQRARSAARYRRTQHRGSVQEREVQCAYTKEGIHHFRSKRSNAKYCCPDHYHQDYENYKRPSTMKSHAPYNPDIKPPEVIYLPDETPERQSHTEDLALLQHQLDEINQNIEKIVEDKVNDKLQEMLENLTSNLLTLLTSKLGEP